MSLFLLVIATVLLLLLAHYYEQTQYWKASSTQWMRLQMFTSKQFDDFVNQNAALMRQVTREKENAADAVMADIEEILEKPVDNADSSDTIGPSDQTN